MICVLLGDQKLPFALFLPSESILPGPYSAPNCMPRRAFSDRSRVSLRADLFWGIWRSGSAGQDPASDRTRGPVRWQRPLCERPRRKRLEAMLDEIRDLGAAYQLTAGQLRWRLLRLDQHLEETLVIDEQHPLRCAPVRPPLLLGSGARVDPRRMPKSARIARRPLEGGRGQATLGRCVVGGTRTRNRSAIAPC